MSDETRRLDVPPSATTRVAPSSTMIQPSAVHTGLCLDPGEQLEKLFRSLVGVH